MSKNGKIARIGEVYTGKHPWPCPLCIVEDRYSGIYSGAEFLAFNQEPFHVAELPIDAGDGECEKFWSGTHKTYNAKDYIIGKGKTPEEAVVNLIILLQKKR